VASLAGCWGAKTSFACRYHHDTIGHDLAIPCTHIVTNPDLPREAQSRPDLRPEIRSKHDDKAGKADPVPMGSKRVVSLDLDRALKGPSLAATDNHHHSATHERVPHSVESRYVVY
jgi:hypothetical protein